LQWVAYAYACLHIKLSIALSETNQKIEVGEQVIDFLTDARLPRQRVLLFYKPQIVTSAAQMLQTNKRKMQTKHQHETTTPNVTPGGRLGSNPFGLLVFRRVLRKTAAFEDWPANSAGRQNPQA